MEENKAYFVIDGQHDGPSEFFYRDPYVSLTKDYWTDKILNFRTRDPHKKKDLNKIKEELKLLALLLNPKAS